MLHKLATALALALALTFMTAFVEGQTAADHDKVIGCYFGAWGFYRPGVGSFDVSDIDPSLCTHGFYGFADLDNQTWHVHVIDPWYDLAPEDCETGMCNYDSYRDFVALREKNPDFVPMLSIGGWNAGSEKFSVMARDPVKRQEFIGSLLPLVLQYGFLGVDFDWEYPSVLQGADPDLDKQSYNDLVKEMKAALEPHGLILSAAFSPNWEYIDLAYDVPFLAKYFDFINVMCYDYHGMWEDFTGHNSPLFGRYEEEDPANPGYNFNSYDTIKYLLSKGAPADKLVMGMAAYGRGFQLNNPEGNGLYCPADTGIRKGPYTRQRGFMGYQEILQLKQNDTLPNHPEATPNEWTEVVDSCYKSPYIYNGPYWIGYDDPESLKWKVRLALFLKLRGVMIWSIDTDDFTGEYSNGVKFPLVRAVNQALIDGEEYDPLEDADTCGSAPTCGEDLSATCSRDHEKLPYPGDCHSYYICHLRDDDSYNIQIYSCDDWPYNPNILQCMDPSLPGSELICGEEQERKSRRRNKWQ